MTEACNAIADAQHESFKALSKGFEGVDLYALEEQAFVSALKAGGRVHEMKTVAIPVKWPTDESTRYASGHGVVGPQAQDPANVISFATTSKLQWTRRGSNRLSLLGDMHYWRKL